MHCRACKQRALQRRAFYFLYFPRNLLLGQDPKWKQNLLQHQPFISNNKENFSHE